MQGGLSATITSHFKSRGRIYCEWTNRVVLHFWNTYNWLCIFVCFQVQLIHN